MVEVRTAWLLLPQPIRNLPADLAAVIIAVGLTNLAVLAPVLRTTPLRIPLGLAFVLFVPGYAFIAALFPEAGDAPTAADPEETDETSLWNPLSRDGIDGIERVALSFGLSIAIVPLLGLVLNFTPWGIRLVPIMVTVSGFTLAATAVAAHRRWELPPTDRFRVPYQEWYAAGRAELLEPDTRADATLNVLLAVSVVLAVGSVGYAVAVPPDGERFSAVYLLTEDDDGELIADDYPTEYVQGEAQEVVVGVDNHEHRATNYTVVAVEQRVDTVGNESIVREQRELDRFQTRLAHNESWHQTHAVAPTLTGEDIRLVWLLYVDEVPTEPAMDDTEYHVHLGVNVSTTG